MKLLRQKWIIVVAATAIALILALVAYRLFFPAPQAIAHLTMQVNPALQLLIDREYKVVGVAGLDEEGEVLLAHLNIRDIELHQALREITDTFMDTGFLSPEARIVVVLHPAGDRGVEGLSTVAHQAHQTVTDHLAEMNLQIEVISHAISEELYNTASGRGLLPAAYVDLIRAAVSEDNIKSMIIEAGNEFNIEQGLFLEEFSTLSSAMIDMIEAGITEAAAMNLIREALQADPSLEEISTITADMIDMHEAGLTPENSLALLSLHRDLAAFGVTKEVFLEEFSTLSSAMIDMIEAGITEAAAMNLIREALQADPSLEEISTITAAIIDLVGEGVPEADALDRVKEPQDELEDELELDPRQRPQDEPEDEQEIQPEPGAPALEE